MLFFFFFGMQLFDFERVRYSKCLCYTDCQQSGYHTVLSSHNLPSASDPRQPAICSPVFSLAVPYEWDPNSVSPFGTDRFSLAECLCRNHQFLFIAKLCSTVCMSHKLSSSLFFITMNRPLINSPGLKFAWMFTGL